VSGEKISRAGSAGCRDRSPRASIRAGNQTSGSDPALLVEAIARTCLMDAHVLPVTAADALLWIRGAIDDKELLKRDPKTECVFIVNIPDRSAWQDAVRKILQLRKDGCKFLIVRTGVESLERHLLHAGATSTLRETFGDDVRRRFILMPTQFDVYFDRLERAVKF
jgi:hypothetical protein